MVKNPPAHAGDMGLIPGSGRSPGGGNDSGILTWEIPRTEEPGGLQSMGLQRVRHDLVTKPQNIVMQPNAVIVLNAEAIQFF